ncbi:MAG: FkbM family methyltransferase [Chloroflexi bacterium]|nr:FkbM family methyltransferase [Chloroflexota bacterium]
MKQFIINLAKRIYLNTPYKPLRSIYYRIFCAMVRNRVVQSSIDGINYKLDLGEVIDLGVYLNRYEPDVTAAIEKLCRPGFTVLDIGANIGAHALRLSMIIGEFGKVYAFEPTNYAYQKLVYNISLNQFKNIIPIQIVLSDKNLLRQSIHFRSSWPTKGNPVEQESIVDFTKLDDWCKRENLEHVDLIKLDVDGNEYSIIKGAESLLTSQHPLILMEVWGPNFSNELKNPFILLKQLGYRFFHIGTGEEYVSIDNLRAIVSLDGKLLDYSFGIVAKC